VTVRGRGRLTTALLLRLLLLDLNVLVHVLVAVLLLLRLLRLRVALVDPDEDATVVARLGWRREQQRQPCRPQDHPPPYLARHGPLLSLPPPSRIHVRQYPV
jgi:hypothetical protein